ncbi:MAG: ABC transporter substrate-binding protein [Thermodesulfobacteriota bacterium]
MKRRSWLLGFLAAMLIFGQGPAWAETGVTDTAVKIGVISDLTGPTAVGGVGMADAIKAYFNEVNAAGGISGRKVEVMVEDCAYSPAKAVAAAKKLIAKDGVFAFVSPWGTAPTTALFPVAEEEKIPIAPACALSTSIFEPLKKYVFAAGTNYIDQSLFIVDYIRKNLGAAKPKIGLFCQDDDWGQDHLKGLEIARKKYDLPAITVETYKYDAIEFGSQVINMMKAQPDFVIAAASVKAGGLFLKEAHKMKWKPTFIGSNTMGFLPTLQLAGEYGKGLLVVNIFALPEENIPEMKRMVEATKKYYGDKYEPAPVKVHPYYVYGWLNAMIFAEGAKRAGKDLTRASLIKALETLDKWNPAGVMGPISYSAKSHGSPGYARMTKGDVEQQRFIPITDWQSVER